MATVRGVHLRQNQIQESQKLDNFFILLYYIVVYQSHNNVGQSNQRCPQQL